MEEIQAQVSIDFGILPARLGGVGLLEEGGCGGSGGTGQGGGNGR